MRSVRPPSIKNMYRHPACPWMPSIFRIPVARKALTSAAT